MTLNLKGPQEDQYDDQIDYWAKQYSLPTALIKGLIALESNFDPKSYRAEPTIGDASRGLMQILYKTAAGIGFLGLPDKLFDPDVNLNYGCKFFATLINNPNYNVLDAVAAYNMGSPRPASKTTPVIIGLYGKPEADWIYANEPYVRRVTLNTAFYTAKFAKDADSMTAILELLKKKPLPPILSTLSWTLGPCSQGQLRSTSINFNFQTLSALAELNRQDQESQPSSDSPTKTS